MPISLEMARSGSFVVAVHNPSSAKFEHLARIELPSANYKAQVFKNGEFVKTDCEILEHDHFTKEG